MRAIRRTPWWVWVACVPLGFGAWANLAPGIERRRPSWLLVALPGIVLSALGLFVDFAGNTEGGLIVVGWLVSIGTALGLRRAVIDPEEPSAFERGRADAQRRLLEGLPGVDAELASRIVAVREDVNGFASLADLGSVMDLDGHQVERMRDVAVFLPR